MKKKIIRRVIVGIMVVLAIGYLAFHYDGKEYTRDNLEEYVDRMCRLYDVPGLSAAVMEGDREFYINYGKSTDENKYPSLISYTAASSVLRNRFPTIRRIQGRGKVFQY